MCDVTQQAEKRLLLHVCCGPCATHSVEALAAEYALTLFFSNSNIAPRAEYDKRLDAARRLASICDVPLVEDEYAHARWRAWVAGLEAEPEGGGRCEKCFAYNLRRTARYARAHGFDLFSTTLTISPHKDTRTILRVGQAAGDFLAVDLKKKGGFQRSVELSRAYGLYRQNFCGCEFSARPGQ